MFTFAGHFVALKYDGQPQACLHTGFAHNLIYAHNLSFLKVAKLHSTFIPRICTLLGFVE